MSGERRDQAEQEVSIRRRGHELFVDETLGPTGPSRPFSEFLRETPAAPIPAGVRAALWAVAVVAALLFAASLWRLINRPTPSAPRRARPRASAKAPKAAARMPATPNVAGRTPSPIDQEPRG